MTTSPVMSITDELLAEIEAAASDSKLNIYRPLGWAHSVRCGNHLQTDFDFLSLASPETVLALLAHIAELKQQAADREAHVRNLIDSETLLFNYLADIRQAVGDDGRLMLPGLVEHIRGMSQQLVAAGVTAENCELFRKDAERYRWLREMHNDEYGLLWVSQWDYEKTGWVSLDAFFRPNYDGELDLDAAIDAARSAGGGS